MKIMYSCSALQFLLKSIVFMVFKRKYMNMGPQLPIFPHNSHGCIIGCRKEGGVVGDQELGRGNLILRNMYQMSQKVP